MKCVDGALLRTQSDVQSDGATGERAWNLAARNGETITGQRMIVGGRERVRVRGCYVC